VSTSKTWLTQLQDVRADSRTQNSNPVVTPFLVLRENRSHSRLRQGYTTVTQCLRQGYTRVTQTATHTNSQIQITHEKGALRFPREFGSHRVEPVDPGALLEGQSYTHRSIVSLQNPSHSCT